MLVRNTGLGRLLVILMLRPVLVVVHSGGAGGRDPESERLLPQPNALEEVVHIARAVADVSLNGADRHTEEGTYADGVVLSGYDVSLA